MFYSKVFNFWYSYPNLSATTTYPLSSLLRRSRFLEQRHSHWRLLLYNVASPGFAGGPCCLVLREASKSARPLQASSRNARFLFPVYSSLNKSIPCEIPADDQLLRGYIGTSRAQHFFFWRWAIMGFHGSRLRFFYCVWVWNRPQTKIPDLYDHLNFFTFFSWKADFWKIQSLVPHIFESSDSNSKHQPILLNIFQWHITSTWWETRTEQVCMGLEKIQRQWRLWDSLQIHWAQWNELQLPKWGLWEYQFVLHQLRFLRKSHIFQTKLKIEMKKLREYNMLRRTKQHIK